MTGMVGRCDGELPMPGRPTIWITVGQGPIALAVGAGGGCLDIFTLNYPFFLLSPSLLETVQYRLNHCLKGPFNPKPTNQQLNAGDEIFILLDFEIVLESIEILIAASQTAS